MTDTGPDASAIRLADTLDRADVIRAEISAARRDLWIARGVAGFSVLFALSFLSAYLGGDEVAFLGFVNLTACSIGVIVMWAIWERRTPARIADAEERLLEVARTLEALPGSGASLPPES